MSRETLQSNRFLKQLKGIIIKRLIQLFTKVAEEDDDKFKEIQESYGSIFKLGAVEDTKNREKLASLARFTTTQRNHTSFDQVLMSGVPAFCPSDSILQYIANKKKGQKQVYRSPHTLNSAVLISF